MTDTQTIPPDRRKNDDWKVYLETRLRKFFFKALVAFAIIGLTSAGSLFGFGVLLKEQGKVDTQIQAQRYDTVLDNCEAQNKRNLQTIKKSKTLSPGTQRVVRLLVNELQPFQKDCKKLALSRVGLTRESDQDAKQAVESE